MRAKDKVISIMQPYLFPNINYFQLAAASNVLVFYDDVYFMKKGWIHRNTIMLNHRAHLFTCPLLKASQNRLICDIGIADFDKFKKSFLLTVYHAYSKYQYWNQLDTYLSALFERSFCSLSELASSSVVCLSHLVNIDCVFMSSSKSFSCTRSLGMGDRLAQITISLGGDTYLNKESGYKLYTADQFARHGIDLAFLASYQGLSHDHRPDKVNLLPQISILHHLATLRLSQISDMINDYRIFNAP